MRAAAFVSGGYLPPHARGKTADVAIHISDWFEAGGSDGDGGDGGDGGGGVCVC